jgi:hypothetical protein
MNAQTGPKFTKPAHNIHNTINLHSQFIRTFKPFNKPASTLTNPIDITKHQFQTTKHSSNHNPLFFKQSRSYKLQFLKPSRTSNPSQISTNTPNHSQSNRIATQPSPSSIIIHQRRREPQSRTTSITKSIQTSAAQTQATLSQPESVPTPTCIAQPYIRTDDNNRHQRIKPNTTNSKTEQFRSIG